MEVIGGEKLINEGEKNWEIGVREIEKLECIEEKYFETWEMGKGSIFITNFIIISWTILNSNSKFLWS